MCKAVSLERRNNQYNSHVSGTTTVTFMRGIHLQKVITFLTEKETVEISLLFAS
jgi:hypothetical protein